MFMTLIIKKSRLKLILGLAMLLLLLLAPLLFDLPNHLAAVVNQSERLLPIYYVHTNEKKVAISFDASWGAERTRKILDTLREFGVKTTFFLTGFWVEDYPIVCKADCAGRSRTRQSYLQPSSFEQPLPGADSRRVAAAGADDGRSIRTKTVLVPAAFR